MHFYSLAVCFLIVFFLACLVFLPSLPGMHHVGSPSTRTMSTLVMLWLLPPAPTTVSSRVCPATLTPFPSPTAVCTYLLIPRRHLMHFIYVVIPGHEGCAWLYIWHKYSQSLFKRKVCHISRKLWVIWLENYTSCQCLPAPAHDNRSLKSHLLISQTSESFKNWSVMQIGNPMKSLSADIKPCPIESAELKPLTHWPLLQMLP